MIKLETMLYKGVDASTAMTMYNRLVSCRDNREPIQITDVANKIRKKDVYVIDIIKTFNKGNHIVSVRYDHALVKYTPI